MSDLTYAYVGDVVKHEEDSNGDLYVYGTATSSALDGDQQRCSPEWLKSAMPAWWLWKNVREQHSPIAAGVGVQLTEEADTNNNRWQLKSLVVDAGTKEKVKKGVLKGYSVGIRGAKISKSAEAPGGIIDHGEIVEISLVDRPCNSDCGISIAKSAGGMLAPVDSDGDSVVHDGDLVSIVKGEAILEPATLQKTPSAKPTPLNMPGARKSIETVEEAQQVADELLTKVTDVNRLDAPNHSQTCVRCAEPGHLWCAPEGFDKDFAVGLVAQVIEKGADSLTGAHADAEASDIDNATQAIAIISQLIASEASELAGQPSEALDISILLDAVASLQCFIRREQSEQTDITPDVTASDAMELAAEPEVTKKSKYDAAQMAAMLKDGSAMANPNGDPSYPIKDAEDLENAIHAVGRGKGDHNAIRSHIVKRAKALGLESKLPDDWTKAVTPDVEKGRTVTFELDGKSYTATLNDEPTPDEAVKTATSDVVEPVETVEVEKAVTPETPVDAEQADTEKATAPDLVKTLTGALKDETSELRELFKSLLHDDTTAKALTDIGARLERVEQMAAPGGPALRRTDVEVKKSRQTDLLLQAEIEDRKAESTYVPDLKKGYADKARDLRAEAKALAA